MLRCHGSTLAQNEMMRDMWLVAISTTRDNLRKKKYIMAWGKIPVLVTMNMDGDGSTVLPPGKIA